MTPLTTVAVAVAPEPPDRITPETEELTVVWTVVFRMTFPDAQTERPTALIMPPVMVIAPPLARSTTDEPEPAGASVEAPTSSVIVISPDTSPATSSIRLLAPEVLVVLSEPVLVPVELIRTEPDPSVPAVAEIRSVAETDALITISLAASKRTQALASS